MTQWRTESSISEHDVCQCWTLIACAAIGLTLATSCGSRSKDCGTVSNVVLTLGRGSLIDTSSNGTIAHHQEGAARVERASVEATNLLQQADIKDPTLRPIAGALLSACGELTASAKNLGSTAEATAAKLATSLTLVAQLDALKNDASSKARVGRFMGGVEPNLLAELATALERPPAGLSEAQQMKRAAALVETVEVGGTDARAAQAATVAWFKKQASLMDAVALAAREQRSANRTWKKARSAYALTRARYDEAAKAAGLACGYAAE